MEQKKEEQKYPITKIVPKRSGNNISNINITNNNNSDKKTPKVKISSKEERKYNVQLTILEETKKLKINLEITEGQKLKRIYIKTMTLEELISLNNFFAQFKDYSEAFDFLLKNFTKIDRNKIIYSNNNNDITIILLFALGEDDYDIIEDSIEITLHRYTGNKLNKSLSNINTVINNLKSSLEKFNLSIKELKSNVLNDKIEKDKRINELEQNFYNKLNELNQEIVINNKQNEDKENIDSKFEDIYNKIKEQNIFIEDIKKNIDENDVNIRNEINKNNKIFLEKEEELAKLISEKFDEFIKRINNYEEKNNEMENIFNDKLVDLDNKTNICFNELIKKINIKNSKNNAYQEDELKEQLNEVINTVVEENENLEKRIENKFEEKINEILNTKIKYLEEKIIKLEKISEEKPNKDNNQNNIEQINNFNSLIKEKFDEIEQIKNNLMNNLETNELKINENSLKINDISEQIKELVQEINKNKSNELDIENMKKEINNKINEIKEENIKNLDEIKTKINYEEQNNEYNKKIKEIKEELNTMINNLNELIKKNSDDINNKIQSFNTDIIKTLEEKNNSIEKRININESKLSTIETKINEISNKEKNKVLCDNNIIEYATENSQKKEEKEKYASKTLNNKNISLKKIKHNSKKNSLSKTLTEVNTESSFNITEKDSDSSSTKKNNIRNSYFISSSNLFSSQFRERTNVFDLLIDSNILKKELITENFFIFTKLKEIYAYNRYIKLNLIYRASRDGDLAKDFHFKCDFIGPNLTLIKTDKKYIFGGFTIKTWKHLFKDVNNEDPECGTELKDEQAFGFSLNKNKIYENGKPDEGIIYCNSNYGPCFKNYFFKIFDKCFENGGICGTVQESNFIGIEQEFEINGGEQYFNVDEIEVFQIAFR